MHRKNLPNYKEMITQNFEKEAIKIYQYKY